MNRSPSLVPSSTRVLSVTLRFARRPSDGFFFMSASFTFLIYEGLCSILVGSETHNELRMEYGYVLVQYSMKVQQQARSHRTVPSQRRLFQPSHHRHRSQRSLRRFSDEARKASQLMACSEGLEGLKSTTSSLRRSVRLPRRSRCDRAVFRPTRTMTTSCRKSSMKKWTTLHLPALGSALNVQVTQIFIDSLKVDNIKPQKIVSSSPLVICPSRCRVPSRSKCRRSWICCGI